MSATVLGFAECADGAIRLARTLGLEAGEVDVHRFPDGESLVRVPPQGPTCMLYRSLNDPNARLVELLLAASAARDSGAGKVVLVAPYLGYMRQDRAFRPGEAVSQRVIGRLLAEHFDCVVTIDPHLHRISRLDEVIPGIPAISLSAAPVLARALAPEDRPLLAGPDSESAPWVRAIADPLGLDFLLGEKVRSGDRSVSIVFADAARAAGRNLVLVDDLVSSGETLAVAARNLLAAGARQVEALATHCLAGEQDIARLRAAGITRLRATDSIPGPASCLPTSELIADAILAHGWISGS